MSPARAAQFAAALLMSADETERFLDAVLAAQSGSAITPRGGTQSRLAARLELELARRGVSIAEKIGISTSLSPTALAVLQRILPELQGKQSRQIEQLKTIGSGVTPSDLSQTPFCAVLQYADGRVGFVTLDVTTWPAKK